ncbi:LacI family DNA-binding transcriptional regulator [Latilactobacillus curvatus]|uniref:LacI family DNA-binding transcriptional regulator n=1 Tax=Latilactobacillus curvatus TaxID=28038 RepID=UPI000F7D0253|nr:LacI family DNA-binding transcriptional regulator [Latilactobacillus curvatus]AZP95887.1 hypothetical protein CYK59_02445 [Latilactobacillus curvatus]MDG2980079.1 LacI family transcriptional regulator [Latilactobacillus curvatus]
MSTIKDVAKLAKVSVGSVSKYLNHAGNLKSSTSSRIQDALDELDYHPNIIAKGLKSNKSMSIGILINSLSDVFAISIVSEIESYVEAFGYSIIICDYKGDTQRFEEKLEFLANRTIDAIVIFHQDKSTPMLQKFRKQNIPIIAIDSPIQDLETDVILVDNYEASKAAVNQLIKSGYQNIGIIAGNQKHYIARERQNGYRDALLENGFSINQDQIWQGDYTIDAGLEGVNQLLIQQPNIDALFVINYYMTVGAILALRQKKITIGHDIGMAVFDHFLMNDLFYPEVTSVKQPISEMGKKAGECLINRLSKFEKSPKYETIYCSTEIITGTATH